MLGQSTIGKMAAAGIVGGAALVIQRPIAAESPCTEQFYEMAGNCNVAKNDCLASANHWWETAACYVSKTVCDEAVAAVYAACLVFGKN